MMSPRAIIANFANASSTAKPLHSSTFTITPKHHPNSHTHAHTHTLTPLHLYISLQYPLGFLNFLSFESKILSSNHTEELVLLGTEKLIKRETEQIMCICYSQVHTYGSSNSYSSMFRVRPKRSKVRVRRLSMTRRRCDGEMELKNLKLYLENRSIIAENEKLRKKALLLHEENQALMFELQKKVSHLQDFPAFESVHERCKYM